MYLGNAYLKIGEVSKALSEFQQLTNEAPYWEQATWYMALCYLKSDENDNAITLSEELIAYGGIHKNKAENLNKELVKQKSPDDF